MKKIQLVSFFSVLALACSILCSFIQRTNGFASFRTGFPIARARPRIKNSLQQSATIQYEMMTEAARGGGVGDDLDTRPADHRAKVARKARRLNHSFRYLYRHNQDENLHRLTSKDYLMTVGGYTEDELSRIKHIFPPLLELDVLRHLSPKMRFLKETILSMEDPSKVLPQELRHSLPPQYFGSRLERIVAPRHAFLVYFGLPHGRDLLLPSATVEDNGNTRWNEFLKSCRNAKQFAALCNRWSEEKQNDWQATTTRTASMQVTPKQIEAFDTLFQRGLMAAARDDLCQQNNTWPLEAIDLTSGELIKLLIQHGANPLERDNRGVPLLHWAAGTGNLEGVQALLPYFMGSSESSNKNSKSGFFIETERDAATPLHWASAGCTAHTFGIGGHPDVCRYILSQVREEDAQNVRKLVNQLTKDGNSALMWAAWSGTAETVKLLIRERADSTVANRNGCTVAHWGSSGGNLDVVRYLASVVGVDFKEPNVGGNTPLTHAVAFGRVEVVEWLRQEVVTKEDDEDTTAASLAWDFVDWTDGEDEKRRQVLDLFEDW